MAMNKKLCPVSITNNNSIQFPDDFSMFCQIAQSPSKSSSSNVSPEIKIRPRSKSMLYENTQNFLLPEITDDTSQMSLSPCRKSLGNLPIIRTMLKLSGSTSSDKSSCRPSLCPMKNTDLWEYQARPSSIACNFMDDLCHVRTFKTTDKGLVNEGDVLISKSTGDIKCDCSSNDGECWLSDGDCNNNQLKIQILGSSGVGKTTLASQFMTSEQICCRMWSVNEESEKLFSLRIDGKEFHVLLHDTWNKNEDSINEVSVELLDKMDAYIVLFAIDDVASFDYSKQMLNDIIQKVDNTSVIYLVGNKADLERSREVKSKTCKHLAKVHRSKFVEISTALNHKVDDLLFDIVMEIMKKKSKNSWKVKCHKRRESQLVTTGRSLGKLLRKTFGAKSCEHIS